MTHQISATLPNTDVAEKSIHALQELEGEIHFDFTPTVTSDTTLHYARKGGVVLLLVVTMLLLLQISNVEAHTGLSPAASLIAAKSPLLIPSLEASTHNTNTTKVTISITGSNPFTAIQILDHNGASQIRLHDIWT